MKKITLLFLAVIYLSITVFGQQTAAETAKQEREKYDQQRRIDEQEARMKSEAAVQQKSLDDWTKDRVVRKRKQKDSESETLTAKDIEQIRAALAPAPEDQAKYKPFLEKSNTGLFRLMPNFGCSQQKIVVADDRCGKSIYIGEFYSFRTKDYSNADWFDLTFKDGNLISKGFFSQGILTTLGDVSLESVSVNDAGIKFLADYQPANTIEKIKDQFREISAGVKYADYQFSKSVKAMPETTYALRVIAYHAIGNSRSGNEPNTEDGRRLSILNYDKRIDLTVAFRVVRVDDDGSLIILWKRLSESKSPELVADKNKKMTKISN